MVSDFSIKVVRNFLSLIYTGSTKLSDPDEQELIFNFGVRHLGFNLSLDRVNLEPVPTSSERLKKSSNNLDVGKKIRINLKRVDPMSNKLQFRTYKNLWERDTSSLRSTPVSLNIDTPGVEARIRTPVSSTSSIRSAPVSLNIDTPEVETRTRTLVTSTGSIRSAPVSLNIDTPGVEARTRTPVSSTSSIQSAPVSLNIDTPEVETRTPVASMLTPPAHSVSRVISNHGTNDGKSAGSQDDDDNVEILEVNQPTSGATETLNHEPGNDRETFSAV